MNTQENSVGKPLANANWLQAHHNAKLPERIAFAKMLAELTPKSIVDLGCATGLWLEVLNEYMPEDCEFVGIDADDEVLRIASEKSKKWKRKVTFLKMDLEKDVCRIPSSDITLAFNIFPYIQNLDNFLNILSNRVPKGKLIVRQYDGASIRFGPMPTAERQRMESDLRLSTEGSQKFKHYDLDRTFSSIYRSNYTNIKCSFELFERTSPFPESFIPYYNGTLDWTLQNLSESSATKLKKWINQGDQLSNRYFFEVDLVAILS